jgi:hypothetical protein
MKKLILLGYWILVCPGIHAQLWYEAGIRAGANVSTQFTSGHDSNVETNWKPGFHIGIYGTLFYSEKMAGQLELLYSQKGSVWSDPDYSGNEIVSYIDFPLTVRFQALELLNIHAGPQFSFLTRAWRMSDDGAAYSVSEFYDEVDVGLLVGAELNLPIKLNIALRYIEGLIVTSDSRYYPDPWKNRVFQLSLSYPIWGE